VAGRGGELGETNEMDGQVSGLDKGEEGIGKMRQWGNFASPTLVLMSIFSGKGSGHHLMKINHK
jgi:hypothetical protein